MVDSDEAKTIVFLAVFLFLFFLLSSMYEATLTGAASGVLANTSQAADIVRINDTMQGWGFFNPIAPILDLLGQFWDLFTFDLGPAFADADPLFFGAIRFSTLISAVFSYPMALYLIWKVIKLIRG